MQKQESFPADDSSCRQDMIYDRDQNPQGLQPRKTLEELNDIPAVTEDINPVKTYDLNAYLSELVIRAHDLAHSF